MKRPDAYYMRRALHLAEKGFTPPNPMVGCVLVKGENIVGEGWHPYAGQPHAEVFALRAAGEEARGAIAYVTLEPCSHWGRTPPCADALIAAEVARVVIAVEDNNPRVAGRGIERLRAAGIRVDTGLLEAEARKLNEAFFHYHATGLPLITLKAAMTLDGKIATRTGDSRWITSPPARRLSHRIRAQSGAVMVGIGTLLADDPALTARLDPEPPRQPLRIVVDSSLQTPVGSQVVRITASNPQKYPLLIATVESADSDRERALSELGCEIVRFPADIRGRVDLTALMKTLAERQIISVLVDGGGELHAGLIRANAAHKALFFVAPKIVGGREAPSPIGGDGVEFMAQAIALSGLRYRRIGPDLLIEGEFVIQPS